MRIFLDANVIFSGANATSNLHQFVLFLTKAHTVITSEYARQEAARNIVAKRPEWEPGYRILIAGITIVQGTDRMVEVSIVEKDRPILATAIAEKCDFLITGDKRDFGHLFNRNVSGVTILTPLMLARKLADELNPGQ